jgi:DNA-binding GntR family transcriptional regulator
MTANIETSKTPPVQGDRPNRALSDWVRGQVSELIHNRVLSAGEVITEQRLAEQLGVSRTPLREALQHLEGEGMVEKEAGRSFRVRKVDFQEYIQSFKVRLLLEPEAAALSAVRAPKSRLATVRADLEALHDMPNEHTPLHWLSDDSLHDLIGSSCGNAVLHNAIKSLRTTTRLYEIEDVRQHVEKDMQQHWAILKALEAEDASAVRKAMQVHLRSLIAHSISLLA